MSSDARAYNDDHDLATTFAAITRTFTLHFRVEIHIKLTLHERYGGLMFYN